MSVTGYSSTMEEHTDQQSMVGPPAADAQSQVGLAAPCAEDIEKEREKLEKIQEELLHKDKLGLYSEKDLLEEGGKKILVDKGNPHVGIEHETGTPVVRNTSGAWLTPADGEYEKTLNTVAAKQASHQEASTEQQGLDKKTDHETQKEAVHQEAVQQIQTMVAIDKGDPNTKHDELDEKALQRIRAGASTMEVKNLKNIVAAVDGFASIEATDINPEMHSLKPTALSGPGVDLMMAKVRERKEKENALVQAKVQRDKEKETSKKA